MIRSLVEERKSHQKSAEHFPFIWSQNPRIQSDFVSRGRFLPVGASLRPCGTERRSERGGTVKPKHIRIHTISLVLARSSSLKGFLGDERQGGMCTDYYKSRGFSLSFCKERGPAAGGREGGGLLESTPEMHKMPRKMPQKWKATGR